MEQWSSDGDGDGTLEKYNASVETNVNDDEWSLSLPLRNERQTVDLWFPGLLSRPCCHLWRLGGWVR